MRSREDVFEDWKKQSLQDFWLISQEFFSSDSDFVELLDRVSYQVKKGKLRSSVECDRYLFSLFLKTLGQKRRAVTEKIYLLALFKLNWPLEKLSSLTHEYTSKIKFLVTQSLKDRVSVELSSKKLSQDCCRADLFLVDYLFDRSWKLPFKENFSLLTLKNHLKSCDRCQAVVGAAEGIKSQLIYQDIKTFEYQYPFTKRISKNKVVKSFEFYQNFSLHWKGLIQVLLSIVLVFSIATIPFVGKFLIKQQQGAQSENEAKKGAVEKLDATWVDLALERDLISPPWLVSEQHDSPQSPPLAKFLNNYKAEEIALSQKNETVAVEPPKVEAPQAAKILSNKNVVEEVVKTDIKTRSEIEEENAAESDNQWIFYRWGAYAEELDVIVPKILSVLEINQAEKAGELDFGAEYRGGRYFHFSIKKELMRKVIDELKTLKLEGFTKVEAKSDRKNKEGHSRIVFLLKQK